MNKKERKILLRILLLLIILWKIFDVYNHITSSQLKYQHGIISAVSKTDQGYRIFIAEPLHVEIYTSKKEYVQCRNGMGDIIPISGLKKGDHIVYYYTYHNGMVTLSVIPSTRFDTVKLIQIIGNNDSDS